MFNSKAKKTPKNWNKMIDVNTISQGEYDNVAHVRLFGGDGTINNFINNHNVKSITLHKYGSGNDLFRSINKKVLTHTYNVNEFKFINSFGYGIDSYVCEQVEKLEEKSYFRILLNSIKKFKKFNLKLNVDENEYIFNNCFCVCACNGRYFGGGIEIAPKASLENEELDIIVIHNLKGFKILLFLFMLVIKKHYLLKSSVFYIKGSNLKIYNDKNIIYQIDGEIKHTNSHIKVSIGNEITIKKSKKLF